MDQTLSYGLEKGVLGETLLVFKIDGQYYETYTITEKGWYLSGQTSNWRIDATTETRAEIRRVCKEEVANKKAPVAGQGAKGQEKSGQTSGMNYAELVGARQEAISRKKALEEANINGKNNAAIEQLTLILERIDRELRPARRALFDRFCETMRSGAAQVIPFEMRSVNHG